MISRIGFGCLFGGLAAASGAQAQFLDLDVKTSHSAYAAGRPQVFTSTATKRADGSPTDFGGPPGSPGTMYSLDGFYATGGVARAVILLPTESITRYLVDNPRASLIPGASAYSGALKIKLDGPGDVTSGANTADNFRFLSDCYVAPGFNDTVGLPVGTTIGACDALDATLRLNGVSLMLTSPEDRTSFRLVIPELGYDFTGDAKVRTATNPFIGRKRSLSLLDDNFFASGKSQALAARLLGAPDGTTYAKGLLPNHGNLVTGAVTVGGVTKSFAADTPSELLAYIVINRNAAASDFGLPYSGGCQRLVAGGPVTGTCSAASGSLSVLGVRVDFDVPANSLDVTYRAPDLDLTFTSTGEPDRDDTIGAFAQYASDNVDRAKLTRAYARYLAENSPSDPLAGNPLSAQGQLNRAALDLDSPSSALGETDGKSKEGRGRDVDTAGWMVGGRAGHLSAGSSEAEFVDANFERGFRVIEGSRMRLKVSLPASYVDYRGSHGEGGGQTATVGLRTALEVPVIDGKWVVEPSAAASAFYSDGVVSSGALYTVGVSSRYKLAPVGRGHIVIGNAVTYSSTLHIEAGNFSTPEIQNTALRNGIAYQVPYGRFLGRQGTVRASYTYTHLLGDELFLNSYHEVALSYGVAGREAAVKQIGETLRLGVTGAFGHDFTAVSATAGYRF